MTYSLYILKSTVKETYYIGSSDEPHRRLTYHNGESKGYTQRYRPLHVAYAHPFDTKQEALKAEMVVKNWKSKKMLLLLIDEESISLTPGHKIQPACAEASEDRAVNSGQRTRVHRGIHSMVHHAFSPYILLLAAHFLNAKRYERILFTVYSLSFFPPTTQGQ